MSSRSTQLASAALGQVLEDVTSTDTTSGTCADLLASHGRKRIEVQLESLPTLRIPDMKGRLAVGVLELRRFASANAVPLILVVTKRYGHRAELAAERFMADHAPDVGWGLLDERGQLRLEIGVLDLSIRRPGARPRTEPRSTTANLFTDLNRWLLKVLLLRSHPGTAWGGPRGETPVRTPTELHRLARVSLEKSHRFARTFEAADFLRRTPNGLRLVRVEVLLEQLLADERLRPARRIPVRSAFGDGVDLTNLVEQLARHGRRCAVGGFAACDLLGVAHSPRRDVDLHVEDAPDWVMKVAVLHPCEGRDADVFVVPSRYPESVLRGAVDTDGLRVVDELQAALDVVADPGRGEEQARLIIERLLSRLEQP